MFLLGLQLLIVLFASNVFGLPSNFTNTTSGISLAPLTCSLGIRSNAVNYPFPYVIPYNTTQSCNIYGPTCQPGSITLSAAGSDCQTSLTTMGCSSYLASQSTYLSGFQDPNQPGAIFPRWPQEWQIGFGRSPQCRAWEKQFDVHGSSNRWDFSECPPEDRAIATTGGVPSQIPPGFLRHHAVDYWTCCGNCTVDVKEVRLYYFEDESDEAKNYCKSVGRQILDFNQTSIGNLTEPVSIVNRLKKRDDPAKPSGSIAVVSGQTLTSPSVYLEVVGTMSVSDWCGPVGPVLTNPFIPLSPGVLSTYSYPYKEGEKFYDPQGAIGAMFIGDAKPLLIPELECPTWGVGRATENGSVVTTIGPPWLPLIIPPKEALYINPEWSRLCPGVLSYAAGISSFAIFDPPRVLVPGAGMSPDLTKPLPAGQTVESPLKDPMVWPGQAPKPDLPKQTSPAGSSLVDPSTNSNSVDPQQGNSDPAKNDQTSPGGSEGGSSDPVQNGAPAQGDNGKDPANTGGEKAPNGGIGSPAEIPSPTGNSDPKPATGPSANPPPAGQGITNEAKQDPANAPQQGANGRPGTNAVPEANGVPPANIIPSNNGPPQVNDASSGQSGANQFGGVVPAAQPVAPPPVLTAGSQTFTPDPTGFKIGENDIKPAGPAATVGNTPVSLDPSGILAIGSSTININPSPRPAAQPLAVGGQNFVPNPAGFQVGGQQVQPAGPAVTISGTPVSLGPSGILAIGSSTVDIGASPRPVVKPVKVGDQNFVPDPAGFEVGGQQVKPAGAAVTVAGTPISLGTAGNLVVGTSTTQIAPLGATVTPAYQTLAAGGQAFTPNPNGFVVAGLTITPGAPAATVAGTPISLGTAGQLAIGSSTVSLAISVAPVLTAGDQTFSANAAGFTIAGTSISPGGAGVTVSGTPISLGPTGQLVVGSQTVLLPTPSINVPNRISVNGQTITANPSGFAIDGSSVLPGGSAVIVSGTTVSLGTDSVLDVGGSKTRLVDPTNTLSPAIYPGSSAVKMTKSLWASTITIFVVFWSMKDYI